jgi:hypothetical protein
MGPIAVSLERLDIFLAKEGTILPTPNNRAAIALNISNIARSSLSYRVG